MNLGAISFNADYSNRNISLNTIDKLSDGIVKVFDIAEKPPIITISEARATLSKNLLKRVSFADYNLIHSKLTYDYIITGYDTSMYKLLEVSTSAVAKCQSMILSNLETNKLTLFVGVHHPHKKGKKESVRLTGKIIITDFQNEYEIDHTIVGGDFNSNYNKLIEGFGDLNLNCAFITEATTVNNTSPDNFLYSDSLHTKWKKVHKDVIDLSHHPLNSVFKSSR
ncbi:hypothetical protein ACTFIV_000081 [Dictyostelium citrinum]